MANSNVISIAAGLVTASLLFSLLIVIKTKPDDSSPPPPSEVSRQQAPALPLVINTWFFTNATEAAYISLLSGSSTVDAVERGCSTCEVLQCDGTVGYGGSPDERGETTLDAMIMDGSTHNVGAVAALRGIKPAISVARHVLEHTTHTLLVGSQATDFAISMGFQMENLTTEVSASLHESWLSNNCQPNYWKNVEPTPDESCGPYTPVNITDGPAPVPDKILPSRSIDDHDTISQIAIDMVGAISCGTSTNGQKHKIPGRVGDAPIAGSGCYVDKAVGGAAATGDGDIMMRFLPSFVAVEAMKSGLSPTEAASQAMARVVAYYPEFDGGIVAATIAGDYGAACHGFPQFQFSVRNPDLDFVEVVEVICSYS